MTDEEFSKFLYDIYKAWCQEHGLDYRDDANKQEFLNQALPS